MTTLYAVTGGRCYHRRDTCDGLNGYHTSSGGWRDVPTIARATAAQRGLKPCGVCKPPPLLGVVPT